MRTENELREEAPSHPHGGLETALIDRRFFLAAHRVVAFAIIPHYRHTLPPRMDSLETRSRDVQERTFCKWSLISDLFTFTSRSDITPHFNSVRLNTKLESQGYQPMTSLVKDLSDGVRLIQLMVRPSFISQPYSHMRGRK